MNARKLKPSLKTTAFTHFHVVLPGLLLVRDGAKLSQRPCFGIGVRA